MASIAAKKVAEEVLATVVRGEIPSVNKIGPKHGYKKTTSGHGRIQQTKSYKETIAQGSKPILEMLEEERMEIMKRLKKTRDKAKYRDLIDGLDKTTKNIQLLSGKETERNSIVFMPMELMKKHGIDQSPKGDRQ